MNTKQLFLSIAIALCCAGGIYAFNVVEDAQATGGVGEIKDLIDPIVERAITALQQNNTDAALEEIITLKNELKDTYELEEENEKD